MSSTHELWNLVGDLKSPKYKWVDLTHQLSPDTPHWYGFQPLGVKTLFDKSNAPMIVQEYTTPGQYGTHVDVPSHFDVNGRAMHQIKVEELFFPLCVIDRSDAVAKDHDYALSKQDVLDWEAEHGRIPEGAMVLFRSDWCKRDPKNYDNNDADGNSHYPGWSLESVQFLDKERNVRGIGHETSDTDPANLRESIGFAAEDYILHQDKFNVELLCNLDQVPPVGAIFVMSFPCLKDGTGFPSRCFAICPRD